MGDTVSISKWCGGLSSNDVSFPAPVFVYQNDLGLMLGTALDYKWSAVKSNSRNMRGKGVLLKSLVITSA